MKLIQKIIKSSKINTISNNIWKIIKIKNKKTSLINKKSKVLNF